MPQTVLLDRYQCDCIVARGGMGEIWSGTDLRSGERVAVKRLAINADESVRDRLFRESSALKKLDHENIVHLLDAGVDERGQPFLVLEWLDGEDLAGRQARSPLSLGEALEVIHQSLQGLAACHRTGTAHRDIKPGNLFLIKQSQGLCVKIIDLGLALRLHDSGARLTQAGTVLGTLSYLSPEQASGAGAIDHRTDIYSMGIVLYELVTGRLPFTAEQPVALLLKILTETPRRPGDIRGGLSQALEAVIIRATQREPSDRFQTAEEMDAAVVAVRDQPTLATGFGPVTRAVEKPASFECRLVTLLCMQLKAPGPELIASISSAVEQAGGSTQELLGGRVIGLFGLERTRGDETLRAVQCGLELCQTLGAQAQLLVALVRLQVGAGLQLDAAELDRAAALLADLPPGELIVDELARVMAADRVELRMSGRFEAVRAISSRAGRRPVLGVDTPTVGRDAELASLRASFEHVVTSGEGGAVALLGPLGIGKTRLLSEVLPDIRRRSVLCLEGHADAARSRPYGLLSDAFWRAAGMRIGVDEAGRRAALEALVRRYLPDTDVADTVCFLGEAIGVTGPEGTALRVARSDPRVMRQHISDALEGLFRGASTQGVVTLCLEDIEAADAESLGLCEQVLERLDDCPIFLLATAVPRAERALNFFIRVDAARVELGPLQRRALRRLFRAILGDDLPRRVEDLVAAQCEGSPYYAEELISWMVARQALVRGPAGWEMRADPSSLQLPVSIESAVQGRLDRLGSDLKELVKAASVFGTDFWEGGCLALEFPKAAAALSELEGCELVVLCPESRIPATRQWTFRHPLLQQVAYLMLPLDRRTDLHLRAAQWLEAAGEDPVVLVDHFQRGGAMTRAAEHMARAGARALVEGNLAGAVTFYRDSLCVDASSAQIIERTLGLARSCHLMGNYNEAWTAIEKLGPLLEPCSSERQQIELRLLQGRILCATTRYAEAEEKLRQAACAVVEVADDSLAFQVNYTLFTVAWGQGCYRDASHMAAELLRAALERGRSEELCTAKFTLGYANAAVGDMALALRLSAEAVELSRQIGHPFREVDSGMLLGTLQEMTGAYDDAAATLAHAGTLATRLGTGRQLADIECMQGRVCALLGQLPEAIRLFRSSAARAKKMGEVRSLTAALVGEAKTLFRLGGPTDLEAAAATAAKAEALAAPRARVMQVEAKAALSEMALAAGLVDKALAEARAAVELLDELGGHEDREMEILLAAREAYLAAGQPAEARSLLERAWQKLSATAARIDDPAVLESFMHRVPHNRRVAELWKAAAPAEA